MAGEPRSVAGRPIADQRSIRLLLTKLDLREDIANQMPRQALVSIVKERGIHLADRAQLEYFFGPGLPEAPQSPAGDGAVRPRESPPPRRTRPPGGEAEAPVGDYRRAAVDAAREAVRQMEETGQRKAPRPWWWRLWPPNWREESS